jgi:hypothetical protein
MRRQRLRFAQSRQHAATRADHGSVPIEFVLGMSVLVLPIVVLVLQIPIWLDRAHIAEVAAHEGARLCMRGVSLADGNNRTTAIRTTTPHLLEATCTAPDGAFGPGHSVLMTVRVQAPALTALRMQTGSFTITRQHREYVSPYRSSGP